MEVSLWMEFKLLATLHVDSGVDNGVQSVPQVTVGTVYLRQYSH
jgi:hypothetical protein